MESLVLNDFTGGVRQARSSLDFMENEWAVIKGFVLNSRGKLQPQWNIERVNDTHGEVQDGLVRPALFDGSNSTATLPTPYMIFPPGGSLTTFRWLRLDTASSVVPLQNDDSSTPTAGGSHEGLCPVPIPSASSTGFTFGYLFNASSLPDSAPAVVVYREEGGTNLRFLQTVNHYPPDTDTDALPKASVGVMWNGVLVIGDTWRVEDPSAAWSASNTKKARNGIYLSEPGQPFRWDQDNFLSVGEDGSEIKHFFVISEGLLVLTGTGIFLLRGTPSDFVLETVRLGLNITDACYWHSEGTVVFCTSENEVWQTDGARFLRLTDSLYLDMPGLSSDRRLRTFGPYLIFRTFGGRDPLSGDVHAGNRYWALRRVSAEEDSKAAWTELSLGGAGASSDDGLRFGNYLVGEIAGRFYFLAEYTLADDEAVFRFDGDEEPEARITDGLGDFGSLYLQTTIFSRTLQGDDGHQKTFWRAVGSRLRRYSGEDFDNTPAPGTEYLQGFDLLAGARLDEDPATLSRDVTGDLGSDGDFGAADVQVRGIGPSREFSVGVRTCRDTVPEQVTVFYRPATPAKSKRGL